MAAGRATKNQGHGLWVVVANQRRARIYGTDSARGTLEEVTRLENPGARAHERDLVTDRPGRSFQSTGRGRHAMQPSVDPKEELSRSFAREIAQAIEAGRAGDRFRELVLAAGPALLGLIRQSLSPATARMVREDVDKNLGQFDAEGIRNHLTTLW